MDNFGNKLFGSLPEPQRGVAGMLLMHQPNANPLILQQIEQAAMGDPQMLNNLSTRSIAKHWSIDDNGLGFQRMLRDGQRSGRLDETGAYVPVLSQILRMLGG